MAARQLVAADCAAQRRREGASAGSVSHPAGAPAMLLPIDVFGRYASSGSRPPGMIPCEGGTQCRKSGGPKCPRAPRARGRYSMRHRYQPASESTKRKGTRLLTTGATSRVSSGTRSVTHTNSLTTKRSTAGREAGFTRLCQDQRTDWRSEFRDERELRAAEQHPLAPLQLHEITSRRVRTSWIVAVVAAVVLAAGIAWTQVVDSPFLGAPGKHWEVQIAPASKKPTTALMIGRRAGLHGHCDTTAGPRRDAGRAPPCAKGRRCVARLAGWPRL